MFQKIIDDQYRRPSGLLGRWIGRKMAEQHVPENEWTVKLLDAQPNDHVLEIGFGPGIAIQRVARQVTNGQVAGVDFSRTMVSTARKRNAAAVKAGRVDLRCGDAAQLPFGDATFDRAYSIHSIYFWPRPVDALREICRVLKPGGTLILTVMPKEKWGDPSQPLGTPECRPYFGAELEAMLRQAGFSQTRIEADEKAEFESNYSVVAAR